jgi:hypothetical protein
MGEYILLAADNLPEDEMIETFVVRMQPDLSIISYQEDGYPQTILRAS